MPITTTKLTRASGVAAVAAGLMFILIQLIHPHEDVATVTTTAWAATALLTMAMALLALVGLAGMYLRQVTESGLLGLVGFLLFGACFLLTTAGTFAEALVLPPLADQAPGYVDGFLATFTGDPVVGDVGNLQVVTAVSAVTYILGGLLFGVALFRARILARWAALLLAVGSLAALLAPVLPHAVERLIAFPVGLALAGLGYSLVHEASSSSGDSMPNALGARRDAAGVE